MPQEPKVDSVQSALSDLMNLEEERIEKETAEEKAKREAEEKRRAAEEAKRKAEEEAKRQAEEEARLAKIKAEQEEMERKQREKELQEIELKKKMEMEQRLKEEELRMKHEEQVKTIEASAKKGFPKWGYAVIAIVILVIAGGAIGGVLYSNKKSKEREAQLQREAEAALALERKKAKERDDQINKLLAQLKSMKDESDMTTDELEAKKEMLAELELLQAEKASGKKKKKKKKKKGDGGKKGCDPLTDPTCGI
jgi:hypothetical protein